MVLWEGEPGLDVFSFALLYFACFILASLMLTDSRVFSARRAFCAVLRTFTEVGLFGASSLVAGMNNIVPLTKFYQVNVKRDMLTYQCYVLFLVYKNHRLVSICPQNCSIP